MCSQVYKANPYFHTYFHWLLSRNSFQTSHLVQSAMEEKWLLTAGLAQSQHTDQDPRAPADVCGVSSFRSVPKDGPVTDISYRILRSYEEKKIISTIKWLCTCSYLYWSLSLPSYGSRYWWCSLGTRSKLSPHRISHTYKIRNILQEHWDCLSPMYKLLMSGSTLCNSSAQGELTPNSNLSYFWETLYKSKFHEIINSHQICKTKTTRQ